MDNPGVRCPACGVVSSCRVFVRSPLCCAIERALGHFGLLRKVPAQRNLTGVGPASFAISLAVPCSESAELRKMMEEVECRQPAMQLLLNARI